MKKIVYISGPGDLIGTYQYWKRGIEDPRLPVKTYSGMFYDFVKQNRAKATILHYDRSHSNFIDGEFEFIYVGEFRYTGRISFIFSEISRIMKISSKIRKISPDYLIISSYNSIFTSLFISRKIKIIYSMHNTFWPMGLRPRDGIKFAIWKLFVRASLKRLYGAICTSSECKRQISEICPKLDRQRLLVERPVILQKVRMRQYRDKVSNILYVGRIEVEKGVFLLLEAFEKVSELYPDIRLKYIGSGGALQKLKERASSSEKSIQVLGQLFSDDLSNEFFESDLLVCPTLSKFNEGLALVGIEAAAHGVPSILSTVVPAQEILADASITFQSDSLPELQKKLINVIEDQHEYRRILNGAQDLIKILRDDSEDWRSKVEELVD